ncbi:MAG: hypothetical protein AB1521_03825 [Bacteroidota bacterium]
MHLKILYIILILFSFEISTAQTNKTAELSLSAELLNGKSWGGVASFSGEINYSLNENYSVSGLYRHGNGSGWFGAVEYKPEMDDDVSVYNEISSCLNYNFNDSVLGLYLGGGIGIIWGKKENEENYFKPHIPIVLGSKINIINGFKIGMKIIGNINAKTTFAGLGLDLIFEI